MGTARGILASFSKKVKPSVTNSEPVSGSLRPLAGGRGPVIIEEKRTKGGHKGAKAGEGTHKGHTCP